MEKKLRAKLEEELAEYRDSAERETAGRRRTDTNTSEEILDELRMKLSEAEEKVSCDTFLCAC